jgi:hypothetical protein
MVSPLYDQESLGSPDLIEEDYSGDIYVSAELLHTERPGVLAEVEIDQLPLYK